MKHSLNVYLQCGNETVGTGNVQISHRTHGHAVNVAIYRLLCDLGQVVKIPGDDLCIPASCEELVWVTDDGIDYHAVTLKIKQGVVTVKTFCTVFADLQRLTEHGHFPV